MNIRTCLHINAAFTLQEVIVAVCIGVVLGATGIVVALRLQTKSRAQICAANLRHIGTAMALYSSHQNDRIPYAGLREKRGVHVSWDDLITSELGQPWSIKDIESASPMKVRRDVLCPADIAVNDREKGMRRTYAMPQHDMLDANWPPGPENATGIGIRWILGNDTSASDSAARWETPDPTTPKRFAKSQPAFIRSMIRQPGGTILLTERVAKNNIVGSVTACTITDPSKHIDTDTGIRLNEFHDARFNYLFVDGHVQLLEPKETVASPDLGLAIPSKMWTVKPND